MKGDEEPEAEDIEEEKKEEAEEPKPVDRKSKAEQIKRVFKD